jgi:hypothetical protein
MDMDMILTVLTIIGVGVIPVVFNIIRKQLGDIKNTQVRAALDELTDATEKAVETAMNTTVKSLRKNGEWNEEVAAELKEAVKASAINSVSDTARKVISKNFDDSALGEKVGNLIECSVGSIKERREGKSKKKLSTTVKKK